MRIVTVIPLKKGIFREDLTYFTAKEIPIGSIVAIPFRNQNILGLVVASEKVEEMKSNIKEMDFNLRKISDVKKNSIFLGEYLEATMLASNFFVASKNNTVASLIPALFREKYDSISKLYENSKLLGLASQLTPMKAEKLIFQASLEERINVYKTLIRSSFAEKKSIFIVLPTESDIENFYKSLSRGVEQFTFKVHSKVSEKKVLDIIKNIASTSHPILIIGTTPFLSIPRRDLGTIILEHESSSNYKMIGTPHIDQRTFVEIFASKINVKLIISDTILRFETIGRGETEFLTPLYPLSFRTNFRGEIAIPPKSEKFKVLTDDNIDEIKNTLSKHKNVFIFTLRKGLATQTICKDCNETVVCETCGSPLVLHLSHKGHSRMFVCNRCQKNIDGDTTCKLCGGWNLTPLGIGTDTVSEELEKTFPKEKIFKLDKESAKNRKGAEKIIRDFYKNPGAILVGTEMAFAYLEEPVPLSIIASFDSLWSMPNFKMSEKIIRIIFSIIEKTTNKIVIQTKNQNDRIISAIQSENLAPFVREELEDRKILGYPPYKRFIKITHLGDKAETLNARQILEETFREYSPEIFSGFIARLNSKYSTNALVKIDTTEWSLPKNSTSLSIDERLRDKLLSLPSAFKISVDPEDLL